MISCLEWVPRGVADPNPRRYELGFTEKELLSAMEKETEIKNGDDQNVTQVENSGVGQVEKKSADGSNELPADLRMDEYSSDEENAAFHGNAIGNLLVGQEPSNQSNIEINSVDSEPMQEDEAMKEEDANDSRRDGKIELNEDSDSDDDMLNDVPDTREFTPIDVEGLEAMGFTGSGGMHNDFDDDNFEDNSEAEDVKLSPNDALMIVAKTDGDFAQLEVHVYEEETGNLFVHHDIPLPSFPLCIAHGEVINEESTGNYCAVGTFDIGIEIWNLDVLNALEPSCILGGEDTTAADELMRQNMLRPSSQKKKLTNHTSGSQIRPGSHTDAVMALSWNKINRHVIASGSADCSVKIWDITKAGNGSTDNCNAGTFNHHAGKVQSVLWHPTEASLLATGSFDRTIALLDARCRNDKIKKVKITADCEALAWDPHQSANITVACEDGTIKCWDVRKFTTATPLWSLVANEYGGVTDLAYNKRIPGMLATCAVDKTVSLWDIHNRDNNTSSQAQPRHCVNKEMGVGKLYSLSFFPSSTWILGCGGGGKELAIWDMSADSGVQHHFGDRVFGAKHTGAKKDEKQKHENDTEGSIIDTLAPSGEYSDSKEQQKKNTRKKKKKEKKKKVHRGGR